VLAEIPQLAMTHSDIVFILSELNVKVVKKAHLAQSHRCGFQVLSISLALGGDQ
jgi:hypothetical protein